MAKTYKGIPSLHRVLESAPIAALQQFLQKIDGAKFAACFDDVDWPGEPGDGAAHDTARQQLLAIGLELKTDVALPLEHHAQRVLTLAEGRGIEAIARVAGKLFDERDIATYQAQLDDFGRSLWLYVNRGPLFDEAEMLFYADHYRNFGRMYEAFEIDTEVKVDFVWDTDTKASLEAKLQERLELSGTCSVTHIAIDTGDEGAPKSTQHLLIVRHAGPLSSVEEMKDDGRKNPIYYRPLNEATVLFSPREGVIEVYAASPGVRPQVAASFAEVGLGHNLSDRPLMLKQYNLSRFLGSLTLEAPMIDGFEIESVAVVDVMARLQNPKHRIRLTVAPEDDIEAIAEANLGNNHIFRRATAIGAVTIAVAYTAARSDRRITLTIRLSDPNRCNLRSNRDPQQRDFGYLLLEKWGILQQVRPLSPSEERAIFPALLQLYDQGTKEISGRFLRERGLDAAALISGGFIVKRGRWASIDIELDSGQVQTVPVRAAGQAGAVVYDCPNTNLAVITPSADLERYEVKRDWVEEAVMKAVRAGLRVPGIQRINEHLSCLGELSIGGGTAPCYLARNLGAISAIRSCDSRLRALHGAGIGVVLSAGADHPAFLGANVVTPLANLLAPDGDAVSIDLARLTSVYHQGKALSRGGLAVEFKVDRHRTGTLYIPAKPALTLTGEKQILLVQRLVDAYHAGNPAVATKDLVDGTGVQSPSQAFRKEAWEQINGTYIGKPPGKRGAWVLLA